MSSIISTYIFNTKLNIRLLSINFSLSSSLHFIAYLLPFLDKEFTLTELHETFLIVSSDISSLKEKRNFRKWVAEYNNGKGMVRETTSFRTGNHRPAKLYTKL